MTNKHPTLADLQNRLTELLLADPRDLPAIIESADAVRRVERRCLANENLHFTRFADHPAGVRSETSESQRPPGDREILKAEPNPRPDGSEISARAKLIQKSWNDQRRQQTMEPKPKKTTIESERKKFCDQVITRVAKLMVRLRQEHSRHRGVRTSGDR